MPPLFGKAGQKECHRSHHAMQCNERCQLDIEDNFMVTNFHVELIEKNDHKRNPGPQLVGCRDGTGIELGSKARLQY